jgi:hypothetical protein
LYSWQQVHVDACVYECVDTCVEMEARLLQLCANLIIEILHVARAFFPRHL